MQEMPSVNNHPIRRAVLQGVREAAVEFIAPTVKLLKLVWSMILRLVRRRA